MTRRLPTHLIALLCALLAWAAPATAAAADSDALAADDFRLVALLRAARARGAPSAHAFLLVDTKGIRAADLAGSVGSDDDTPLSDDALFRIGSITKTFTALALVMAANDGALDLDDPLDAVVGPGLIDNPWAATAPVRIVHLLEHSAGLADLAGAEFDPRDPRPVPLAKAVHDHAEARRVLWPPGRYFSYTNAGAGLAAYALERATGSDFESFLATRVLAPLGMTHASLHFDDAVRAHLVPGYDADGRTVLPYWQLLYRPFGALNVRPREMAGLLCLLLGRGVLDNARLLPADAVTRMERPVTTRAAASGLDFGYGLGLYSWYHDGTRFFGHGGDGDGYLAHFGYSPAVGLGYFLVINAFDHATLDVMRELVEDRIVAAAPAVIPPPVYPDDLPAAALGPYRALTARFGASVDDRPGLVLERRADGLFSRRDEAPAERLLRVDATHWRRAGDGGPTIALLPDGDGWLFLGERGNFQRRSTP
ncbi:MAG: serine hydrolase domain-containing protein [Gammaproteobacteria bacterium]